MRNLIVVGFILFSSVVYACSCTTTIGYPFCYHNHYHPNSNVITGVIIDSSAHSIRVKVIDRLRGSEPRDTITIWDGTDEYCQGSLWFSMKVSGMGIPGDTLITIIPKITLIENTWDVIGDYRRPDIVCTFPSLRFHNDSVFGYINGAPNAPWPLTDWTMEMNYPDFKAEFSANSGSCLTLSIEDSFINEAFSILQHSNKTIDIQLDHEGSYQIELINTFGQIITSHSFQNDISIDLSEYNHGVYILLLKNDTEVIATKKIYR